MNPSNLNLNIGELAMFLGASNDKTPIVLTPGEDSANLRELLAYMEISRDKLKADGDPPPDSVQKLEVLRHFIFLARIAIHYKERCQELMETKK